MIEEGDPEVFGAHVISAAVAGETVKDDPNYVAPVVQPVFGF